MIGTWIFADDDKDWSQKVAAKSGGHCSWPGCTSHFGLGAHHAAVSRGFKATRLIVQNGAELCAKHHKLLEDCKGTIKYDQLTCILIGRDVYFALKELAEYSLKIEPIEDNMKSSEVSL